jgi:hypothetical protein
MVQRIPAIRSGVIAFLQSVGNDTLTSSIFLDAPDTLLPIAAEYD